MRTKKSVLKIDVYTAHVYFYYCERIVDCVKLIRKKYPLLEPHDEDDADALSISNTEDYPAEYWIILTPRCSVREVAHEAVHISNMILHERDVQFSVNHDEPYAYMIGHITEIGLNFLNKMKNG